MAVRTLVRDLNPRLPREVQTLQAGALANSFGNGLILPFLFIYLHNVRAMSPAVSGLIVGTNSLVSLIAGPAFGPLVDRFGGRRTMTAALAFLAVGFGSYPLVHRPWQGFCAATLAGIGNGGFWPSQSTLIAGLTPPERRHQAFAMQRMMMNLGIGLGAVVAGQIASTEHPVTYTVLFLADAGTFLAYMAVLQLVPQPERASHEARAAAGGFAAVLRHRVFVAVVALNAVFITAGLSQIDVLPGYLKNDAGHSERTISIVFLANTITIVLAQLPVARLQEGRRRMATLASVGAVWGGSWALVPAVGGLGGTAVGAALFCLLGAVFGIGECLHGSVQAPLVSDLADPRLLGRYMAASAFSWSVGFAAGPALGGFGLGVDPAALWEVSAAVCVATGGAALALDRLLPASARWTPGSR
ncbi:MAG TPA: MFS transporter [Gaiellales bacterium]|nr:MFS transporter [Gaiellales bacterium]